MTPFQLKFITVLLVGLGVVLGQSTSNEVFGICGNQMIISEFASNFQHAIASSQRNLQYYVVYVSVQQNDTNVFGELLSNTGSKVTSGPVPLHLEENAPFFKQNPVVAFSETSNVYFAVWQLQVNESHIDLIGRPINGDTGLPITPTINIAENIGLNHEASISWNPSNDEFVVVWAQDDSVEGGNITQRSDILLLELSPNGSEVRPARRYFTVGPNTTSFEDRNPSIQIDADRNRYLISLEYALIDVNGTEFDSNVWTVIIDIPTLGVIRAIPVRFETDMIDEHSGLLMNNPTTGGYTIFFEQDDSPGRNESGPSQIFARNLDSFLNPIQDELMVSASEFVRNRNPSIVYVPQHNAFTIAYEGTNIPALGGDSHLRLTSVDASLLSTIGAFVTVANTAQTAQTERQPRLVTLDGLDQFLALWVNGPDLAQQARSSRYMKGDRSKRVDNVDYEVEFVMSEDAFDSSHLATAPKPYTESELAEMARALQQCSESAVAQPADVTERQTIDSVLYSIQLCFAPVDNTPPSTTESSVSSTTAVGGIVLFVIFACCLLIIFALVVTSYFIQTRKQRLADAVEKRFRSTDVPSEEQKQNVVELNDLNQDD